MPVPLIVGGVNGANALSHSPVVSGLSAPQLDPLSTVWKHDYFDAHLYETVSFDHFTTPYHHYMESIFG